MEWNIAARAFQPREKKREQEKHERQVESEIIKLYPNGEVMVINRTQLSDNNTERNVEKVRIQEEDVEQQKDKEEEIIRRRKEVDGKMRQIVKEHEEEMARLRQWIRKLEQEERKVKEGQEKEERNRLFSHLEASTGGK